jgi:hypothetical protein
MSSRLLIATLATASFVFAALSYAATTINAGKQALAIRSANAAAFRKGSGRRSGPRLLTELSAG